MYKETRCVTDNHLKSIVLVGAITDPYPTFKPVSVSNEATEAIPFTASSFSTARPCISLSNQRVNSVKKN